MEHSFLHSKKILLVDDQPELLTLVREILTDDGFCHLASAGTVEQALSVCRTQRPDLAILQVDTIADQKLQEVVIMAKLPTVEMKPGKMTYRLDASITQSQGNVYDLSLIHI